jgi:hypothetical protein
VIARFIAVGTSSSTADSVASGATPSTAVLTEKARMSQVTPLQRAPVGRVFIDARMDIKDVAIFIRYGLTSLELSWRRVKLFAIKCCTLSFGTDRASRMARPCDQNLILKRSVL